MVYDSAMRDPYSLADDAVMANAKLIRDQPRTYHILLDWPGVLMWCWASDHGYIVTYIYIEEGAK